MNNHIVKETPKFVEYEWGHYLGNGRAQITREKKFLCVGGPHAGQMKANCQLHPNTYFAFNSAGGRRRTRHKHSQIYIHQSLL